MKITRSTWSILGCVAILVLTFLVFGRALDYGFVNYDDPAFVTENNYVNKGLSADGVRWAFTYENLGRSLKHLGVENVWHPLTWLSHMADVSMFGVDGVGVHHGVSLLLHGLCACLVFFFFGRLFKSPLVGFLAALFFALHPMKTESVVWISERKDVLSGFFFWASLCAALRSYEQSKGAKKWTWVGLGCFALALMSKPSVVILPLLLILIEGYMRGEKKWSMGYFISSAKRHSLWFALSVGTVVIALYLQATGSHSDFMKGSLLARWQLIAPGFLNYVWRGLVPVDLTFHYARPMLHGLKGQLILGGSLLVFVGSLSYIWSKRRQWPLVFLASFWMVICWLPMSGLAYVGTSFTADRYMYLALAGPFALLAYYLVKTRWGQGFGILIVLLWGGLSWKQTGVWKDSFSLFENATQVQPRDPLGWVNLGGMHQLNKEWDQAIDCHHQAISLNSRDYTAHYNLGYCQAQLGKVEEAKDAYFASLKAYPNFDAALKKLGLIFYREGDVRQANELFLRGCQATQNRDQVLLAHAMVTEFQLGRRDQGAAILRQLEALGDNLMPQLRQMVQNGQRFIGSDR